MHDFDKIVLTRSEQHTLQKFLFCKRVPEENLGSNAAILTSFGLIKANYSGKKNSIGEQIPDGTYSLTDFYYRYRKYRREQIATPIFISVISSVITAAVTAAVTATITLLILRK